MTDETECGPDVSPGCQSSGLVGIVILNYNGGELLTRCVQSFQTVPESFIVVVDNDSVDGSLEPLEQLEAPPTIIRARMNLGYTGGNNVGIEYVVRQGAEFVLIVNADTLVMDPAFVSELTAFFRENKRAGIVGPRVCFQTTDRVQNTICHVPSTFSSAYWWFAQRLGKKKEQSGDRVLTVPVLNGVCILIRSDMLREIGLFDNDIFMYREDTDLALRANAANWTSHFVPVDSILHLQKSEGYDYLSMVNFLLKRNAVYVLKKNGRHLDALGIGVSTCLLTGIRAIIATIRRKQALSNWRFLKLLSFAFTVTLLGRYQSKHFGPPNNSWKVMAG